MRTVLYCTTEHGLPHSVLITGYRVLQKTTAQRISNQVTPGPWIFGPFDFLKTELWKITFPFRFSMTVELRNRRSTSFNESEASLLVIRQIRLCRRGASVAPRSRRLALCPCATATTLSLDSATRWLASKTTPGAIALQVGGCRKWCESSVAHTDHLLVRQTVPPFLGGCNGRRP